MKRPLLAPLLALLLTFTGSAHAQLSVTGQTLRWEGANAWQRPFTPQLGRVVGPVTLAGRSYVGVGPVVYAFDRSGKLLGRADLPAQVSTLDSSGGAVRVSVGGAAPERFTLTVPEDGKLGVEERVVFPPDPQVTQWLARFADSLSAREVRSAARQFPLNPFLALREAELASREGKSAAVRAALRRAMSGSLPFPAWTTLAQRLDTAGFPAAAETALVRAKRDAAARGLDPALPVSREALLAYGNPSGYVGTLLEQNRLARADRWMNFLRELYPRFEGSDALYRRYADTLDAQGRSGEAEEWRQFARSLRSGTLYNLGADDTHTLRDVARLTVLALLLALVAAVLVLGTRAWGAQEQDLQPLGGRWRSWRRPLERLRLGLLSYASLGERLMLLTLLLTLLAALAGWQWTNQTARALQAPALNIGTYGGGWSRAQLGLSGLDVLPQRPNQASYLLAGLTAQLDGDLAQARTLYTRAGTSACAVNNLGVIAQARDDAPQARSLYQRALTLQPDLSAAAYNLGRNPVTPETTFQRTYRPAEPRLCYPDRRTLARAVSGDMGGVLRRVVVNPLGYLVDQSRVGKGNSPLDWAMIGTLLGLGVMVVLLLIPRAGTPQRRPLSAQLLALLLPGTGFLNNAWGGVLLLTWAGVVTALLVYAGRLTLPTFPAGQTLAVRNGLLTALLALYALNLVAWVLGEAARRRALARRK